MAMLRNTIGILITVASIGSISSIHADEITISLRQVTPDGLERDVGKITFHDHQFGLLVVPDLHGLTPGPHGAHIHENPDCGPAKNHGKVVPGGAAGGHFNPNNAGRHEGPYGQGHLGDLPNLLVEGDGSVSIPVVAPRLRVADIRSRAIMIHAGADRYMHHGAHMHGKGGMRMYCGVIP